PHNVVHFVMALFPPFPPPLDPLGQGTPFQTHRPREEFPLRPARHPVLWRGLILRGSLHRVIRIPPKPHVKIVLCRLGASSLWTGTTYFCARGSACAYARCSTCRSVSGTAPSGGSPSTGAAYGCVARRGWPMFFCWFSWLSRWFAW